MFLERMRSQDQREKEWIPGFQVLNIVQPFAGQVVIHPSDITGKMLQVFIGKTGKRWPCLKLFIEMGNCPEQVGKPVMLQQVGILEQGQQELSLLCQEGFEPIKV